MGEYQNKIMKRARSDAYDELPTWDRQQLRLFSMVSREFVLPLSFVAQVNQILADENLPTADIHKLRQLAQEQLSNYVALSQSVQQIYHGSFETLPLEPLNPLVVVDEVFRQHASRLQRAEYQAVTTTENDALVLSNRSILAQSLGVLLQYIEAIQTRAGLLYVDIKASVDRVSIRITDSKSSVTRPQIKQALSLAGQQKQVDAKYLNSALQLVIAQNLSQQINGKLDFQRRRGRAQWTISLPRSQQLALWA